MFKNIVHFIVYVDFKTWDIYFNIDQQQGNSLFEDIT